MAEKKEQERRVHEVTFQSRKVSLERKKTIGNWASFLKKFVFSEYRNERGETTFGYSS